SSTKVAKSDKNKQPTTIPKTKGLVVLSEVALTEAEQLKLATKKARHNFTALTQVAQVMELTLSQRILMSNNKKVTGTNKGVGVIPKVPDVPKYDSESEEESWTFNKEEEKADKEEVSFDQRVSTPPDYELTDEEENKEGDDKIKEGKHKQEEDDLYRDVNLNLERSIIDKFLASKMKEAVDVVDSTMKAIIKEKVQDQVSNIMPQIEKYVTKSLGAEVLA
ncbi:hypothetical protein Tco_1528987, partial [Tanacetum coccineum]